MLKVIGLEQGRSILSHRKKKSDFRLATLSTHPSSQDHYCGGKGIQTALCSEFLEEKWDINLNLFCSKWLEKMGYKLI